MLREKLLARLGLLVVGFVAGAVVSIVLLQNVLRDLDAMKSDATAIIDGVQDLGRAFAAVESQNAPATGEEGRPPAGGSIAAENDIHVIVDSLSRHEVMQAPAGEGAAALSQIKARLPQFLADKALKPGADQSGPQLSLEAAALRNEISELGAIARRHIAAEQAAVSQRLRVLIVGLTIAALVITNIAIFVLVRTANMVLRPVEELIEGSRHLAREQFEYRIKIDQHDEFDELARAYNALAEQLAANEQRKVKALQQLAVTLNHELNNVINIIELQLRLVNRRTGGDPVLTSQLGGIHVNLERMAGIIASLRSVRRVVVTDYLPGETMLDLSKCIEPDFPGAVANPETSKVNAT